MRQYLCYMSPWGAMKMHPLGECAMDLSSLGLRPRDDLDPLPIHPRDAISLHPSGSCSKNIVPIQLSRCEKITHVSTFGIVNIIKIALFFKQFVCNCYHIQKQSSFLKHKSTSSFV